MNRLIAIITGLHVLAHTVFGCCSHDTAHASAAPRCCHSAEVQTCVHRDTQTQQLTQAPSNSDASQIESIRTPARQHHDCVHSSCQWLESKPISTTDVFHLSFNGLVPIVPSLIGLCSSPINVTGGYFLSDAETSAPPLRLHLALGVMQI
jgi:hypothetical protein